MSFLPFFFRKKGGSSSATYTPWRSIGSSDDPRENLGRLVQKTEDSVFDPRKHKDTKRSQIALIFVWGYVIIVGVIIIGVPVYNWLAIKNPQVIQIDTTLAQVGALIGSPLGFVVGYYFKEDKE